MLIVICAALIGQAAGPRGFGPQIREIGTLTTKPRVGAPVEIRVDWAGKYQNPFDPAEVSVDALVTPPTGKAYTLPGFYFEAQKRALVDGKEVVSASGEGQWRFRIHPHVPGVHRLSITVRDRNGVKRGSHAFEAAAAPTKGIIRVSPRDRRYFEFANGQPYFPIGANVCWGGDRGTFNFDEWFPAYGRNGANYSRLWLSPFWSTFALETKASGVGKFDQAGAWKLDYVVNLAQRSGLNLMLTIDSYNILRAKDGYPAWEETPHNRANGGPLANWKDFWTDAEMRRRYQNKLRYLVARYSAYPNVMAWEFWNEVDLTGDFEASRVRAWHQDMARALRGLDPYDHLISTSFSGSDGVAEIDRLPEIDYVQTHHYGTDPVGLMVSQQKRKAAYGKPHYVGEIGADWRGPENDPEGVQVHDPLWIGVASGSAGTGMAWWWDSLIAPKNLYYHFAAVAKFVQGVDFPAERFAPATLNLRPALPVENAKRSDLIFEAAGATWSPSEYNRPIKVAVDPKGTARATLLPAIQHGLVNHPKLHNPITFQVHLPFNSALEIRVTDVSGYGGAALRVKLDGRVVLDKPFPDESSTNETLRQFAGTYSVPIPAGRHEVTVENVGPDWFMATYRFPEVLNEPSVPIRAWGVVGRQTALIWLRQSNRDWTVATSGPAPAMPASRLRVTRVAPGDWTAEIWDTYRGRVLSQQSIRVPLDGGADLAVPSFKKDIAVRLRRKK